MPLYEYRCAACGAVTSAIRSSDEAKLPVVCDACGGVAERILSRPSVHLSKASKLARLDPRYDRMVDSAMRNTQHAEPDHHLRKLKPLSDD
ncbi:MAG: zinc ribbon domain-containing protein [Pseudomonadales bacterium]